MLDLQTAFDAVSSASGVSQERMLSASRIWPCVEARMLLILLCARLGQNDGDTAKALNRSRSTITKARLKAEPYLTISKSFNGKFNKAKIYYETAKSVRLPEA